MARFNIGDVDIHLLDKGHGPVLMLVHGFPLDHTMWSGQIAALSDHFRILAPDLRGFGNSGITQGTVTMEQMAADLESLLERLEIEQPICLCGLSMGGYVAWQFWRRFSDRLDRLILCDTRAAADSDEVARGRQLMAENVSREGTRAVAESMLPKLLAPLTLAERPDLVSQVRQVIQRTDPAGIAAAQRGMALRPDFTQQLRHIQVPALIVCGEHDAISGPAEMRQIANELPNSVYAEIRNAGHLAPLEQPQQVNAVIRRFLEVP